MQSTQGVKAVHVTPAATLRAQLEALAGDVQIAAVKIGMLGNAANAAVVAEFLDKGGFAERRAGSGGAAQRGRSGSARCQRSEISRRGIDEARLGGDAESCRRRHCSTGLEIKDVAGMEAAARKLVERGARAVVVKGGHMDKAVDRAV